MKKITLLLGALLMTCASLFAQAPANCPDVMLQGFHWDSFGGGDMDRSYARTKWEDLKSQVDDIAETFTMIWLPPSAKSSGGTGYHPKEWSNQNSDWGSKTQLKEIINAFHAKNCKVIADIVINHRDGNHNWGDFCNENFGTYGNFQDFYSKSSQLICKDDEIKDEPNQIKPTGNNDDGYERKCNANGGYCASRDLDHSNTYLQGVIKAYLKWMKGEMGYDGWRYDLVKGYLGKYTKIYNEAAGAYYSVGEYWDRNYGGVKNWIEHTGKTSTAFDFPNKYATFNDALAGNKFGQMINEYKVPNGLCGADEMKRYATTFIDNHDTFRDGNKYQGDWTTANAVLLAQPGIPCVFYPHWEKCKKDIKKMVAARKAMGIHSQSKCTTAGGGSYYQSTTTGTKGTLICFIGSGWSAPSGYTKACGGTSQGTQWAYYTSSKVDPIPDPDPTPVTKTDITIKVKAPSSWTQCYLWAWDSNDTNLTNAGEWPGTTAMTKNSDGTYSYTVKNVPGTLNFLVNDGIKGGEQTADVSTTSNSCWVVGSKNASNENKYDMTQNTSCDIASDPTPTPNPNPGPTPDPTPSGSITLKVKASSLPWGNKCYLYTWDGGELGAEVKYTGEWPGTAMTLGSDGYYTYTVNQSTIYAIFTDGSASGALQTDDIQGITTSTCYELSSEQHENMFGASVYDAIQIDCPTVPNPNPNPNPNPDPTPSGSITLKVKASSLPWGNKCYLYTWDGGELGAEVKYTGEWPGTAMTLGSDGYYTYTVNQSVIYAIFTDGSASGTLQTDDIQGITVSTCYELSSEQHENMLGASVYDAIQTDCPANTAIIEAESVNLTIYPNPTSDFITISCDEAIEEVVINAINGSEVIRANSNQVDLSALTPSMYFVNVMLQNGDVVRSKVIRK